VETASSFFLSFPIIVSFLSFVHFCVFVFTREYNVKRKRANERAQSSDERMNALELRRVEG
jgi:hypothetical protein